MQVRPNLEADPRFWRHVRAAKYIRGRIAPEDGIKKWLAASGNFWDKVHSWHPERDRDRVTRDLRRLRDFRSRHGIELYVVNLPELSWNRVLYQPGRYEAYLDIVESALGETPFLDLRTFLPDDDFYDSAHPHGTEVYGCRSGWELSSPSGCSTRRAQGSERNDPDHRAA